MFQALPPPGLNNDPAINLQAPWLGFLQHHTLGLPSAMTTISWASWTEHLQDKGY